MYHGACAIIRLDRADSRAGILTLFEHLFQIR